jgi:glycosyltransferase involved in cell wall biosynthesis
MNLSVIICTFNPPEFIFDKCLTAISEAAHNCRPFEIIIVDNNSTSPVANQDYVKEFLSRHDNARVVVEKTQGLTPARLRGIKESTGDILVFIDDDNWIYPDFFNQGLGVADRFPHVGAWSGQVKLRFEKEPEEWTRKYWGLLVHREFDSDKWSNFPHLPETMPCGAGLFVRKSVADHYCHLHHSGKRNIQLDRSGNSLFSGGDNDLAACACDIGLGVGLFPELILEHYIPQNRTTFNYLVKLAEGIYASAVVFKSFRGEYPVKNSLSREIVHLLRMVNNDKTSRAFLKAVRRGERKGMQLLKKSQYKNDK